MKVHLLPFIAALWMTAACPLSLSGAELSWWKGNLHTHTLWSDGDDYPEQIAKWYKDHGYHFLALSDHNTLQVGERWVDVMKSKGGPPALQKYLAAWGKDWVQQRDQGGRQQVRLRTLEEFRKRVEEPNRFLMIQSEEVTDRWKTAPVHMNATNLRHKITPQGGDSVYDVMQRNMNALLAQRKATGQPMFLHLNHPNFGWGVTAEELMRVKGEQFFEVYNGHPSVRDLGDATHASTERMWDIINTRRLTEYKLDLLYGLATDDAHNYHGVAANRSNTGRGWVMVRAAKLNAAALVTSMEKGDFYSSTGVTLKSLKQTSKEIDLTIQAEAGVQYTTQFIGTRRGYDATHKPITLANGTKLRVTHRYSADVGQVLVTVKGPRARYVLKGDEIYVRAKIVSSKPQKNGTTPNARESAWLQPVTP